MAPKRPTVLVFDVNETLSDMSPMADRFAEVGAPAHLAATWFASVLRDGFALTAVGVNEKFATVAQECLRVVLHEQPIDCDLDDAVQHVMDGFTSLPVHPDVPDGVRALADAGFRLVTLSNGSTSVAEDLFERAGVRDCFEQLLSVEDAPLWKPAAAGYTYALEQCDVEAAEAMLVAVHPWDVDGAKRAGLSTAWVDRDSGPYPSQYEKTELSVPSLHALAADLGE